MSATSGSALYYDTGEEVRLGDRVRKKRWFRPSVCGTVCYIPGISPPHPELEYEDVRQWAIRLDNGTILVVGYHPSNTFGQPTKDLVFMSRGKGGELLPDEKLP